MAVQRKYRLFKLLLAKAYFDKGFSLTNYFKYALFFFGLFDLINVEQGIWLVLIYCLGCYVFGRIWYKLKIIETENEIHNIFNPFQNEVRSKLLSKA